MSKSLLALLVAVVGLGIPAGNANASSSIVKRTFDAGIGRCFLPQNVYGGSGPTITAPSVRYSNNTRRLVRVKAFAIIVNAQTGATVRWRFIKAVSLRRRHAGTFPETTLDLPTRPTSAFWPAAIHVELDVYSRGKLAEVWTGRPSRYKQFTNGAFFPTYTGTGPWC
jgi:hypothetical protein